MAMANVCGGRGWS